MLLLLLVLVIGVVGISQPTDANKFTINANIRIGASQTHVYLPLLDGKRVGIVANQTSVIGETHLVDSLLSLKVNVVKVFSPEHGFRGTADAGQKVDGGSDPKTGLEIVSLYGSHKKPKPVDLKDVDIVIFDIQDVGVRFYTYISTMAYVMEACAENVTEFLVLDRPNPNGHYVDGPVLEKKYKSFIGMHKVPIIHGMTVAEYAKMLNEEGWLKAGVKCDLEIVACQNYSHADLYELPVRPSPNLPNMASIYLYPSLCLFEGTVVSVGRGTKTPFQIFGHPKMKETDFEFIPIGMLGARNPKLKGEVCKGVNLSAFGASMMKFERKLKLEWLIQAYQNISGVEGFFLENGFFNLLAGNGQLKQQIIDQLSEGQIRASWEPALSDFKKIRKKYLLYQDFE